MSRLQSTDKNLYDIVALLHDSLPKFARRLRDVGLPRGITRERISTLTAIETYGPVSVTALAEMARVRSATMSRMISSLAKDGLVRRQANKTDKRGVLVVATVKGRRSCQRANQQYREHLAAALAELEPDQLEAMAALASALEKLTSVLER